jgi:hypothetical protein
MLFYTLIEYVTISLPTESSIFNLNPDIIIDDNSCKAMKSRISIPTMLTVIVVAIILALPPLSPLPLSASSDSDESETNAGQRLREKNLGSGESDNFNCDENMITSASGVDCIPSGPAPPTPSVPFTIVNAGSVTGALNLCEEGTTLASSMEIDVTGDENGRVTGTVTIDEAINVFPLQITSGTTDGNTFSLSGPEGRCAGGAFTVSGECGINASVRYEEGDAFGNYGSAPGVECTLL